jgi:chorismate lyase/3-hydroxybenzoate synthase
MLRNALSPQPVVDLQEHDDALAVLQFGNSDTTQAPSIHVAALPDEDSLEIWQSNHGPVTRGQHGQCSWRRDSHFQFTTICVPLEPGGDHRQAAETAYNDILSTIVDSPAKNLVRFWNYVPAINLGQGDDENYKQFCVGRLNAFNEHNIAPEEFPAASAVGHHRSGLTVCAISSVTPAEHHTNPRQVDAFEYPRQYGPSSPSFARASTLVVDETRYCFISGTASILGHQTVHEGDLELQLHTTNDNILLLLDRTGFAAEQIQTLRVYLRDANQLEQCRKLVQQAYPHCELVLAEADICRRELLVEIEAFCAAPTS